VTRVAAIDCGTNSIRLLVADVDAGAGTLVDVDRRLQIVRLGQGVDETGRLSAAGLERTLAACRDYARVIERLGAERVRMVATSATRDAANRDDFVYGVQAVLGVTPEVVSGAVEAELSFTGATRELDSAGLSPYLVVDIGGGSTEFVLGTDRPEAVRSVDVGCVRLTERHLRADPPTPAQVAAARDHIDSGLDEAARSVPLDRARTLVGLAGSVTTVAAIALRLPRYDPERIHRARIPAADVHTVTARLLALSSAERAALPVMHPGRADVIAAGALILDAVLERLPQVCDVLVSEHDILDGMCWCLAAG